MSVLKMIGWPNDLAPMKIDRVLKQVVNKHHRCHDISSTCHFADLVGPNQGILKAGRITVPLTSCLTGLKYSVLQIKTKIVSCHMADSKPVKQEINVTVILPPLVFLGLTLPLLVCQTGVSPTKETLNEG
jgi:hypothetical protein